MYVSDGFWHALEAMNEPSVTYTFGQACTWFHLLSTEVFGSEPMRQVPNSWMLSPGGTSYDQYQDFEERGDHFAAVVRAARDGGTA